MIPVEYVTFPHIVAGLVLVASCGFLVKFFVNHVAPSPELGMMIGVAAAALSASSWTIGIPVWAALVGFIIGFSVFLEGGIQWINRAGMVV